VCTGYPCSPDQRPPRQDCAWKQERRAELSVDAATDELWPAARQLSTARGSLRPVCRLVSPRHTAFYKARRAQHLQMAMTQMNVQLHHVISGISVATGQDIVSAIVAGKRNAAILARLRDRRIKADEAEVAAALQGNWRDEHLFVLKQEWPLSTPMPLRSPIAMAIFSQLLAALKIHELHQGSLDALKRAPRPGTQWALRANVPV